METGARGIGAAALALGMAMAIGTSLGAASADATAPANAPSGAATGGPPAWVTAGTRITHYSAFASVGSGGYELIEDPNGPLEDPTTGKRYRESYTATTATNDATGGGGSGDGFSEANVVAVEGTDVVLASSFFANEPLTGTRSSVLGRGERVAGANVPGLWYRPDLLTQLKSGDRGAPLVLHGPLTVGGKEYQAISIVDPTPGAYFSFAFDAVTGVQLMSSMRTVATPGGPVQLGYTELRSVRQLAVPGIGAAVPSWLAARPQLSYSGTMTFRNPMDPLGQPQTSALTAVVAIDDLGATWALVATTTTVTTLGSPVPSTSTGAMGGAGPYWWDPAALATMTVGQVLDTDPVTGLTLTVTAVTPGAAATVVTIDGSLDGESSSSRFDAATGVLLAQSVTTQSSGITTAVQLHQMP